MAGAWLRVRLGPETVAFVPVDKTGDAGDLTTSRWRPSRVLRSERPLGVGVVALGETFGLGAQARFQSMTRVALVTSVAAVLDGTKARGTSFAAGLQSSVILWNLTPFAEAGLGRASSHDGDSTQRVAFVYLKGGVEWMFDFGIYVSAFVSWIRSADVEIVHELADARAGKLSIGHYGVLDLGNDHALQRLLPGIAVGYAF